MSQRARLHAMALVVGAALALVHAPAVAGEQGPTTAPSPLGAGDARDLLEAAASALDQPHVGTVSVVTFSEVGPRVADLDVRVGAVGELELRRPSRWLLGAPGRGWLRTADATVAVTPAATGLRLDVATLLDHWTARVGPPRGLDTGPATPVHLVRREGPAIEEVVYVDVATALPVRRETRAADGSVLRVVAYTSLTLVELGGPGAVSTIALPTAGPAEPSALDTAAASDVPLELAAGFELLAVEVTDDMATARYGDGLSVLSLYRQQGRLDASELVGAEVRALGDRDVWTWPGSEPQRLVWTGGGSTWTVVSDAPAEVVFDAIGSLPGDHVGHDVPSRVRSGVARAWTWLRDLVT